MGPKSVTKADVTSWIERALERKNFKNYEISLTGKTEKGDGYFGDIVFATVAVTTRDNIKKNINLVIKHGKPSDHARKIAPVRVAFETEIHFYKNVLPAFCDPPEGA
ncbi:hypothetical protein NQ318_000676 [Aromia moschata]|uniref:Uncharacterized protein n=1 Tax=Aromia moschata TaxID=1265417 RepID=A0AAV8XWY7_9CUCU|nr:hypothetical protein NQ318_000676 [Aromia moschata]